MTVIRTPLRDGGSTDAQERPPTVPPLPDGLAVRLRPTVRRMGDGRVLVGGSPTTVLRLSPRARALVADAALVVGGPASREVATRLLAGNLADPDPAASTTGHELDVTRDLTVVVPVRDRADELDRVLSGLARRVPAVVVDDGSSEPDSVAAVTHRWGARLVRHEVNRGPAPARNTGLQQVATRAVAFVDSDVSVTTDDLARLLGHLADPGVALVAPRVRGRVVTGEGRWFERYDADSSSLDLGAEPAQVRPGSAVPWVPSACLVGRVGALGTGFDEGMRVGEDVDLVWRLLEAGWRVRYEPVVVVGHEVRTSLRAWLGRKVAYGTSSAGLASRHTGMLAPAVLPPALAGAAVAVVVGGPWSVPVVAGALGWSACRVLGALPPGRGRVTESARLVLGAAGWTARQSGDLLLRHWWPATLALAPVSARVRRAAVAAAVVDLGWRRAHGEGHGLTPLEHLAARRLDDAAYGAGVWLGAWRAHSLDALRPRLHHAAGRERTLVRAPAAIRRRGALRSR